MRRIPIRPILGIIAIVLIVVLVRMFACSGPEGSDGSPSPGKFTDYVSENGQARLLGFYQDASQSTEETATVYLIVGLRSNEKLTSTTIDAYVSNSLVRFLSLDDAHDYDDEMSAAGAAMFQQKGITTASYEYASTIKGTKLAPDVDTKMVAMFHIDQAALNDAETISVWFDICNALMNTPTEKVGYDNVILKFPAALLAKAETESDILSHF